MRGPRPDYRGVLRPLPGLRPPARRAVGGWPEDTALLQVQRQAQCLPLLPRRALVHTETARTLSACWRDRRRPLRRRPGCRRYQQARRARTPPGFDGTESAPLRWKPSGERRTTSSRPGTRSSCGCRIDHRRLTPWSGPSPKEPGKPPLRHGGKSSRPSPMSCRPLPNGLAQRVGTPRSRGASLRTAAPPPPGPPKPTAAALPSLPAATLRSPECRSTPPGSANGCCATSRDGPSGTISSTPAVAKAAGAAGHTMPKTRVTVPTASPATPAGC